MIGEYSRRIGFWILDFVKGSHVKKHLQDIRNKIEHNSSPEAEVKNILKYAREHVPFYQNYNSDNIRDYPVMNKEKYNQMYQSMRSIDFQDDKKLHWVRTSGSTGTPFRAPQDQNKRNRTKAELLYFHKRSGWNLGDRYLFIRAWVSYNASILKRFIQNFVPLEATNFDENKKEEMLHTIIHNRALRIVFGYSSIITDFADYLEKKNVVRPNEKIKLVVVDSDTLMPGAKEKIEKVFGCKLMNRYDNEEHGVLACMFPGDDFWTVNTASYHIELLKINENKPCAPGEVGRVVVTDLTNKAFPFIRYDIGDLAYSNDYDGTFIKTLNGLEGKAKDIILDTKGNRIGNVSFAAYFELFMQIKKYQLIQEDTKSYKIKIELKESMTIDTKEMIETFKGCLGQDANIEVMIVDKIETTGAGKYCPVVSNLKRQ